jgi:hypothetical protein
MDTLSTDTPLINGAANRAAGPSVNGAATEPVVGDAAQVHPDRDADGVAEHVQRPVEVGEHLAQRGHRDHGVEGAEGGRPVAPTAGR